MIPRILALQLVSVEKVDAKACRLIIEGDSFCSNTTGKQYLVKSHEAAMSCAPKKRNLFN